MLIKELPKEYRELALSICKGIGLSKEHAMEQSLKQAFLWMDTPQGYYFWSDIYYKGIFNPIPIQGIVYTKI